MLFLKSTQVNGKQVRTREYDKWSQMMYRCTPAYSKTRPTYTDCVVSAEFRDFQYFAEWCNGQMGFGKQENGKPWQLDKDILLKGNKVYGPTSCVFVPKSVNVFLTSCKAKRGLLPVGVSMYKATGKYRASCNNGKGKEDYLGTYSTPTEAFLAYKVYKENLAKKLANVWEGSVDRRVVDVLRNLVVNVED